MCGINVIYKPNLISEKHISIVEKMNSEMKYRGPDAQIVWSNDSVVFGHVRLSIIGIDNGAQPIFSEDKNLVLICNGEIYNYIELKKELEKDGIIFHSDSDCETILFLYQKYGLDFVNHLRGMFAIVIWDKNKKEIIAVRDRMGKKPLYFSKGENGLVLSSEIKTITKYFLTNFSYNNLEITNALKYSYPLSSDKTIISEVDKIQPGEIVVFKGDSVKKEKYWDVQEERNITTSGDYFKDTHQLLKESVDIRLRSDVPIAVLLSSGIDSTTITALAKECRDEVHAITVGYKNQGKNDERELAKRFAKEKGIIYHEVELDQNDFKNYFEEYTATIDEPVCDIAAFAQWGIYKKAKDLGFKVLLSGIGGDELFYGYPLHSKLGEAWTVNNGLKQFFPIHSWKGVVAFTKYVIQNKKQLNYHYKNSIESLFMIYSFEKFKSFSSGLNTSNFQLEDIEMKFKNFKGNGVEKMYAYFLNEWLINNCFYQTDKLAMGNSVEVRAPFADHKLIEFVMTIPFELKYNPSIPKCFLKEIMKNDLPDYILNMPKKGFSPPMDYINEIVGSYNSTFFESMLFDYNQVLTDKILTKHSGFQ